MVFKVKSPDIKYVHEMKSLHYIVIVREGELGRIIDLAEEKHCQQLSEESYQTVAADHNLLNCDDIDGKEKRGQKKRQFHISCFRCYVCLKILKEREVERVVFKKQSKQTIF